jgi:hypothetical protein
MSDRGTPATESKSKPQWPTPDMYTGEGKDRDLQQINALFRAVANYINSYGIKNTGPDALQYYGTYCSNSVADQFKIFRTDIPDETKIIPELKKYFETYFFSLTSSDDLWCQWKSIKQRQEGRVQPVIQVIIKFKNLRSSLARNMILGFGMKQ